MGCDPSKHRRRQNCTQQYTWVQLKFWASTILSACLFEAAAEKLLTQFPEALILNCKEEELKGLEVHRPWARSTQFEGTWSLSTTLHCFDHVQCGEMPFSLHASCATRRHCSRMYCTYQAYFDGKLTDCTTGQICCGLFCSGGPIGSKSLPLSQSTIQNGGTALQQ